MKTTIIAFSLVANAFLLGLLAFPDTAGRILSFGRLSSAPSVATVARPRGSAADGAAPTGAINWSSFEGLDGQQLIEKAQASGLPPAVIRALLQYKLNEPVSARRRELQAALPKQPYWKANLGSPSIYSDPKAASELRQLSQANSKLINDLLGKDPNAITSPYERLQYGNLPPDKVEQLKLIVQDYAELSNAVRGGGLGVLLPEDRTKLSFYDDEKDKDIRALLTPAEYEEYQFRASTTANSMRNNLIYFEPTEAEFRAIFPLQQAFEKKYSLSIGAISSDLLRERSAAQQQLNAEIKGILDSSRAAEYDKATDSAYRTAMQLVTRLELPKQNATIVWQTQKDIMARATAIRTDRSLSAENRTQKMTELKVEAETAVAGALGGARGLDTYKQAGGAWLNSLVPPPAAVGGGGGGGAVRIGL